MKNILIVLGLLAAVFGVIRYRQIQQERELEAEIWAEATDTL